jgi:ATP-dependent RNA helicase RhlE
MKENTFVQTPRSGSAVAEKPQALAPEGVFGLLMAPLQRAVAEEGYLTPTPIQDQCIPHLLKGRDLLGTAQTGTGKTAAFTLPLLQLLSADGRPARKGTPRALILAPTRELAAQIGDSITTYGRHLKLSHTVIFGGVNQLHQVKALHRGVDILVATPGRLLDLMQQGYIRLNEVQFFILDEVDRMLDMGFINDINKVLAKIPENRQTLFFSATMAPKMEELAYKMVRQPVRVTITPDQPTVERINQKVLFVGKRNKDALLISLLENPKINKAIIFTQMKHAANRLVKNLSHAGINGDAIHGNKSQAARTKALDGFKQGRVRVLVATDVAARGLDVDDITHVINYDLPIEAETYVHRIGRTARAGTSGEAISFCCAEERSYLREIERLLGKPVPADMDHVYHCNDAVHSRQAPPKQGGGARQSRGRQGSGSADSSRSPRQGGRFMGNARSREWR